MARDLRAGASMGPVCLSVRVCEIVSADGSRARSAYVYCPGQAQSVELGRCKGCAKAHEVTADAVVCSPDTPDAASPRDTAAGEATASDLVCVRADVPCQLLVAVAPKEPWNVPVVDDKARFLGFVSSRQLTPPGRARRLNVLENIPARYLSSGSILAIHEGKPVRTALRIMARHGTRLIALVDDAGVLRGALSDIQGLKALGRP